MIGLRSVAFGLVFEHATDFSTRAIAAIAIDVGSPESWLMSRLFCTNNRVGVLSLSAAMTQV